MSGMNPGFAKYLASRQAGKTNVAQASTPKVKATPKAMGNAHVGKAKPQMISSGKMANSAKVTLGTTHGNHDVAHPC